MYVQTVRQHTHSYTETFTSQYKANINMYFYTYLINSGTWLCNSINSSLIFCTSAIVVCCWAIFNFSLVTRCFLTYTITLSPDRVHLSWIFLLQLRRLRLSYFITFMNILIETKKKNVGHNCNWTPSTKRVSNIKIERNTLIKLLYMPNNNKMNEIYALIF